MSRQIFLTQNKLSPEQKQLHVKAVMASAHNHKTPHINVSYSLISMYNTCPRQAFFRLVLPQVPQNQAPFIGGSVAHRVIETWAKDYAYAPGWMQANYEQIFNEFESKQEIVIYRRDIGQQAREEWGCDTDREFQLEKVRRCVEGFEQFALERRFKEHNVQFERWMTKRIGDSIFYIKGSADIFDYIDRQLYDVKTTASPNYGEPLQLWIYSLLIQITDGVLPSKAQFLLPIIDNPVRKAFIPDATTNMQALYAISEFIKHVNAGDFDVTPSPRACGFCPFKSKCPVYGGTYDL